MKKSSKGFRPRTAGRPPASDRLADRKSHSAARRVETGGVITYPRNAVKKRKPGAK